MHQTRAYPAGAQLALTELGFDEDEIQRTLDAIAASADPHRAVLNWLSDRTLELLRRRNGGAECGPAVREAQAAETLLAFAIRTERLRAPNRPVMSTRLSEMA